MTADVIRITATCIYLLNQHVLTFFPARQYLLVIATRCWKTISVSGSVHIAPADTDDHAQFDVVPATGRQGDPGRFSHLLLTNYTSTEWISAAHQPEAAVRDQVAHLLLPHTSAFASKPGASSLNNQDFAAPPTRRAPLPGPKQSDQRVVCPLPQQPVAHSQNRDHVDHKPSLRCTIRRT